MRIAILGCGSIGRRHARNLRMLGCADLFLYDPDPSAREAAAEEVAAPALASLEAVWERGPEVAFVTSPSAEHVHQAMAAALRGCHLFIEKPLSHGPVGIDALRREVDRRGLVSMVGCNMRFHPGPETVLRLLGEGRAGRVVAARIQAGSYLPRWRPWQDYRDSYSASPDTGGAILDMIHEIDLALHYFGPARLVAAVSLPAEAIDLRTDGLAELLLRHESGVVSNVHLNFVQRDYRRTCQVIGSAGTLYWDFAEGRVQVFGPDGTLEETLPQPPAWEVNDMYVAELRHFLACVESGRDTGNSIAEAAATLEIALAAREQGRKASP